MNKNAYCFELITRSFCGGANPERHAEIRAPSIRGQLRWWFRTLGGFKSLAPMPTKDQEAMIFGSVAGDKGAAGKLMIRTLSTAKPVQKIADADELGASISSPEGYLLFPLRSKKDRNTRSIVEYKGRASLEISAELPRFDLHVQWRGEPERWTDIEALLTVFGHLGSLGFRSRRAMGALAFANEPPMSIEDALARFIKPSAIVVKSLPAASPSDAVSKLANWLKGWRSHGRSPNLSQGPGFRYAKNDHDRGIEVLKRQGCNSDVTYRPSLGLPIIQFYSSPQPPPGKLNWEESPKKGEGRFASPVILRPYRDTEGKNWSALVIFVDARKWPSGKKVYLNGQPRDVSLELYDAMKNDANLLPFP